MSLSEFLVALEAADGSSFCSPPGLGGTWLVKHIRSGLGRHVLVPYDGIIAFARNPKHGVCQNCARIRGSECTHCNCTTCIWQTEVDGRSGPKVTPEQVAQLQVKLRRFQIGRAKAPVVALDAE